MTVKGLTFEEYRIMRGTLMREFNVKRRAKPAPRTKQAAMADSFADGLTMMWIALLNRGCVVPLVERPRERLETSDHGESKHPYGRTNGEG